MTVLPAGPTRPGDTSPGAPSERLLTDSTSEATFSSLRKGRMRGIDRPVAGSEAGEEMPRLSKVATTLRRGSTAPDTRYLNRHLPEVNSAPKSDGSPAKVRLPSPFLIFTGRSSRSAPAVPDDVARVLGRLGSTRSTRNDRGDSGTVKEASIIGRVNDGQALSLQAPRQGQGDSRTCEVCGHRGAAGQPKVSGSVRTSRAMPTILPAGVHPRRCSTGGSQPRPHPLPDGAQPQTSADPRLFVIRAARVLLLCWRACWTNIVGASGPPCKLREPNRGGCHGGKLGSR
jgi:hypothetical protein